MINLNSSCVCKEWRELPANEKLEVKNWGGCLAGRTACLKLSKTEIQTTWDGQLVSGGALAGGRKHEHQSKAVWAEASVEGDEKR